MNHVTTGPNDAHFDAWAAVFERAGEHEWGRDHCAYSADEHRARWHRSDIDLRALATMEGNDVVGAAFIQYPKLDNTHLAVVDIAVLPQFRRRGIGTALLRAAENTVINDGRTVVLIEAQTRHDTADAGSRLLIRHGYAVAQTVARNAQRLPLTDALQSAMRAALETVDAYQIETAVDSLPESWLEDRAALNAMMMTDTPLGDLAFEPEIWDAERVKALQDNALRMGRRTIEAVARHRDSGELVAYTRVEVPAPTPWVAYQDDTLVMSAHRGHGLGYRLKAAVSLLLPDVVPGVEVQRTWNDETNDHMLRVNRALGYEREGTLREWQKTLHR